jgi:outer membrane usher protein
VVGWDGLVYLEDLAPQNHLRVDKADGGQCQAAFALPEGQGTIPLIGPLVCQ